MSLVTTQIRINDHGAIERLAGLPALQKQAMTRALNRTAQWARTRTVEAIVGNLALKASDLNGKHRYGGVTVQKAGGSDGQSTAKVLITGKRIPLFRFDGDPKKAPTPAGIVYQISTGYNQRYIGHGVFFAKMKSGHKGFFRRLGGDTRNTHKRIGRGKKGDSVFRSGQAKLAEMFGPSIPHVAEQRPEFKKLIEVDAGARLELQMEREVNFILTGSSKGLGEEE